MEGISSMASKNVQDQLVLSPGWDTDADALNIQKCSLGAGLQTMVVLVHLTKTTWVVLMKPRTGNLKGCQEAFQDLKQSWKRPVGWPCELSQDHQDHLQRNFRSLPEDRSKGLSNSCQPSFCSSLGLFQAGQGLLAFSNSFQGL